MIQRDKANLDIFWIKDESLEDSDNLPEPDVILQEIIENLESALAQLREYRRIYQMRWGNLRHHQVQYLMGFDE